MTIRSSSTVLVCEVCGHTEALLELAPEAVWPRHHGQTMIIRAAVAPRAYGSWRPAPWLRNAAKAQKDEEESE